MNYYVLLLAGLGGLVAIFVWHWAMERKLDAKLDEERTTERFLK